MSGVLAGLEDAHRRWTSRRTEAFVGTSRGLDRRRAPGRRAPAAAPARDDDAEPRARGERGADGDDGAPGARPASAARSGRRGRASAPLAGAGARARRARAARWRARAVLCARGRRAGGSLARPARARRALGRALRRPPARLRRRPPHGRRVVFGAPGAPPRDGRRRRRAPRARSRGSSRPVRIGEREYVDGGAWSLTNLDAAPAGRGTQVLCLDPAAGLGGERPPHGALRGAFRVASGLRAPGAAPPRRARRARRARRRRRGRRWAPT